MRLGALLAPFLVSLHAIEWEGGFDVNNRRMTLNDPERLQWLTPDEIISHLHIKVDANEAPGPFMRRRVWQ